MNKEKKCLNCKKTIKKTNTYCSQQCKNIFAKNIKIKKWLNGEHDGMRGKTSTAHWIREYMMIQCDYKCMKCNWGVINRFTNKIPIELNHIDGNFKNNKIENLEIICPNCHALTSSYKGANKKSGRPRSKYYRGL